MKPTPEKFKQGAREAWAFIQKGHDVPTLLRLADPDYEHHPYHQGWTAQCQDPEVELHPPDYRTDDGDTYVGIMIALALMAFVAFVVTALLGFHKAAFVAFAIALWIVVRISRNPSREEV